MTDVKERVARAICRQNLISTRQPDDAKTMDHYWKSFLPEADAALSALGWAEMVEALDGLLKVFVEDLAECGYDEDDIADHDRVKAARTALSRARGEKT
jgi:hypothetical protein